MALLLSLAKKSCSQVLGLGRPRAASPGCGPEPCCPVPQEKERNARRKKKKAPAAASEEAAFPPVVEDEEMEASGVSGNEEEMAEEAEGELARQPRAVAVSGRDSSSVPIPGDVPLGQQRTPRTRDRATCHLSGATCHLSRATSWQWIYFLRWFLGGAGSSPGAALPVPLSVPESRLGWAMMAPLPAVGPRCRQLRAPGHTCTQPAVLVESSRAWQGA